MAKSKVQRVANLRSRFQRIKAGIMVTDTLVARYLDRVAEDIETANTEIDEITTLIDSDTPPQN